jgi:hypothetical protein
MGKSKHLKTGSGSKAGFEKIAGWWFSGAGTPNFYEKLTENVV